MTIQHVSTIAGAWTGMVCREESHYVISVILEEPLECTEDATYYAMP